MKLLCATDLLPETDSALERSGFLSDSLGATLTLLHVVAPGTSHERVDDERLGNISASLIARTSPPAWRWKSRPDVIVLPGSPAQLLIETAARQDARLVILGPHRVDAFADTVRSTTTEQVLSAAHSADAQRYRIAVVDGRPASTILQSQQNLQADLVVLGTRGHGRIRRALLGSDAMEVFRRAQCDVLLVPALAAASR